VTLQLERRSSLQSQNREQVYNVDYLYLESTHVELFFVLIIDINFYNLESTHVELFSFLIIDINSYKDLKL